MTFIHTYQVLVCHSFRLIQLSVQSGRGFVSKLGTGNATYDFEELRLFVGTYLREMCSSIWKFSLSLF